MELFDFSVLAFDDIVYAALGALFITWIIRFIIKIRKLMKNPMSFLDRSDDIRLVIQRCYKLFPNESVSFNGEVYKRGMKLKIVTLQKKIFEGEFIGCNEKNMLCLLTNKYIIAHEITNIEEIEILDSIDKYI